MPVSRPQRSRLGELLLEMRLVEEESLGRLLSEQQATGRRLTRLLTERGVIDEDVFTRVVAQRLGIDAIDVSVLRIHERVLSLVPADLASALGVLPVGVRRVGQSEVLYLATSDPLDEDAIAEVQRVSAREVRVMMAPASQLDRAISKHYPPEARSGSNGPDIAPGKPERIEAVTVRGTPLAPPSVGPLALQGVVVRPPDAPPPRAPAPTPPAAKSAPSAGPGFAQASVPARGVSGRGLFPVASDPRSLLEHDWDAAVAWGGAEDPWAHSVAPEPPPSPRPTGPSDAPAAPRADAVEVDDLKTSQFELSPEAARELFGAPAETPPPESPASLERAEGPPGPEEVESAQDLMPTSEPEASGGPVEARPPARPSGAELAATMEVPFPYSDLDGNPFDGPALDEVPVGLERTGIFPAVDEDLELFDPPPLAPPKRRQDAVKRLASTGDIPMSDEEVRFRARGPGSKDSGDDIEAIEEVSLEPIEDADLIAVEISDVTPLPGPLPDTDGEMSGEPAALGRLGGTLRAPLAAPAEEAPRPSPAAEVQPEIAPLPPSADSDVAGVPVIAPSSLRPLMEEEVSTPGEGPPPLLSATDAEALPTERPSEAKADARRRATHDHASLLVDAMMQRRGMTPAEESRLVLAIGRLLVERGVLSADEIASEIRGDADLE